jgi:beta-glucanase (GH16 family)
VSVVDGVEIDVEEDVLVSTQRWTALVALLAAAACVVAPAAHAAAPPTWADEFNGSSLDLTRWNYRGTGVRNDGILTPDAVAVGGGALTIKTYTEAGKHYSGMISTLKSGASGFEQAYGYFEARIRFSSAPGQWSAFWLQSPTIGSPLGDPTTAGVEMDIVEHRARCVNAPAPTPPATCSATNNITNRAQQGLIWDGYGAQSKLALKLSDPLAGLGNASWHTWALRWTPTNLTFYYDGTVVAFTTTPISHRSQYIILSSEVGQFFAGPIPPSGYGTRATSLTNMQVDYVRVWADPAGPASTAGPPAPAPPLPAPPAADTTAPSAKLLGGTSQRLRATVPVTISCPDESCLAAAAGTVRVPRVGRARATTYSLRAHATTVVKGTNATVRLKLSAPAQVAIRRALRARRRVVVKLRVRVADGAGNVRPLTRQVRLRL